MLLSDRIAGLLNVNTGLEGLAYGFGDGAGLITAAADDGGAGFGERAAQDVSGAPDQSSGPFR